MTGWALAYIYFIYYKSAIANTILNENIYPAPQPTIDKIKFNKYKYLVEIENRGLS